ncbi:MAG: beta-galactosidase, partial [Daejeonella sp.]|nr:beta-galactosidase [Daejeonella sp.]
NERPFVAAAMIWNLADFNSETREETMPHVNNKGLLTLDRQPKDLYRFYQSQLLKTPFIKISNWHTRSGLADSSTINSVQPVDVFSNASTVQLVVNGKSLGEVTAAGKRFTWQVPFINGINKIEAVCCINGQQYRDVTEISFDLIPDNFQRTTLTHPLNILLGAKRIVTEDETNQIWMPAKEYKSGSWGYIGGTAFKLPGNSRQSYGTDRNIRETENDPVYQTQQVGIKKFKFDVVDGEYELIFHFAELTSSETKEVLAYNLDNSLVKNKAAERIFDIVVNSMPVFKNLNISNRFGTLTAGSEKLKVVAKDGKGIEILFNPVIGEPVLNAIQLVKIL